MVNDVFAKSFQSKIDKMAHKKPIKEFKPFVSERDGTNKLISSVNQSILIAKVSI